MKKEVNPKETSRANAFSMWMSSPMPMVTLVKTFDVTRLVKVGKKGGVKFNVLMCWCIGKAAKDIKEFYILPEQGKLFQFDRLAINVIVENCKGGINSCDIPYSDDLQQFNHDYLDLTRQTVVECKDSSLDGHMVIGTSALGQTEIDCVINQYSGIFNNPFLVWGRYRKKWLRYELPISFQFHHVQMDGGHAARFLHSLQEEMANVSRTT